MSPLKPKKGISSRVLITVSVGAQLMPHDGLEGVVELWVLLILLCQFLKMSRVTKEVHREN